MSVSQQDWTPDFLRAVARTLEYARPGYETAPELIMHGFMFSYRSMQVLDAPTEKKRTTRGCQIDFSYELWMSNAMFTTMHGGVLVLAADTAAGHYLNYYEAGFEYTFLTRQIISGKYRSKVALGPLKATAYMKSREGTLVTMNSFVIQDDKVLFELITEWSRKKK